MIDTPSIIVNTDKLERNIISMQQKIKKLGVSLRPHTKTHKTPDIAKMQIDVGAKGICTATISEAEAMVSAGIDDIFIAYPIVTEAKIKHLLRLHKQLNVIVGVDSIAGAIKLSNVAKRHNTDIQVRLEVDTGLKRTGVLYHDALKLAYELNQMEGLLFRGIYTYRGAIINGAPTLNLEQAGLEEGQLMVELAKKMRAEGIVVRDVSVGSTPTAYYAAQVKGVTEVRPGTYTFYDRMQAKLGACSWDECAAVIRVTVVSRPTEDLMIIDGGSKAIATDVGPNIAPLNLDGFGQLVEAPHAFIERVSEEHGMVRIKQEDDFKVGDVVHIIPNHICSTINLHNSIFMEKEDFIKEVKVEARGKLW